MCSWYCKKLNVKVFNLILRTNETRQRKWLETYKCKCRLNASVCYNKQRWNDDKCRCDCKELIDKGVCNEESIWNSKNCQWQCNKSCDVREYLDYKNWKCGKNLVENRSAEENTENIDEVKIADQNECVCSYIICLVLTVIALTIRIGTGAYFVYSCWYLKKDVVCDKFGTLLKQQFNELINGKRQTNRDQKPDLSFLQRHN